MYYSTSGSVAAVDEEHCVINGIGRIASFVYLGNELDAGRGCLCVVTARLHVGLGSLGSGVQYCLDRNGQ